MLEISSDEFDGLSALEYVVSRSPYGSVDQAIASLTLFSHPGTVERLNAIGVFQTVRNMSRRGEYDVLNGVRVMFDDNKSPTDAFVWANGIKRRGRDLQFNHIYQASDQVDHYTNLRNVCVSPAFLAKLTDTHPAVGELLRFRAFELYGYTGPRGERPTRPEGYESLRWAATAPPAEYPRGNHAREISRRKDRTARCAKELGWG